MSTTAHTFPTLSLTLVATAVVVLSTSAQPVHAQANTVVAVADLPRVIVTATRFADDADQLPLGVSVITAKEIRDSGATTVNEAVMKLLGVPGRLDAYGGGDYALDLRGFGTTSDNNQVVIVDGVRLSEADTSGTRLAGIPIDAVERIEVLRGSGSVLYGEGATGGAIVITTKGGQRRPSGPSGQGYAAAGSHRLREVRASGAFVADELSLDLSAARRASDNHRDNFHSRTENAAVATQWARDGVRLGARFAVDDLDTGLPGALSAAQYAANPQQSTTPTDHADIRNQRTSLFSEAIVGGWTLGADLGWRDKALRSRSFGSNYDYDVRAKTLGVRARRDFALGGVTHALVAGLDRNDWTREVLGSFGSVANQRSRAFYLKDDVTLTAGTRLSAGLRSEEIDKAGVDSTAFPAVGVGLRSRQNAWELGVTQPLGGGYAVYGRLGKSFRLPNADEFTWVSPGSVLVPQTSHDVELGARWHVRQTRADLRAYRSNLTHEIGYDPNAAGPFGPGANINFDPTRRQGIELEVTHDASSTVQLRANAAWRRAQFRDGQYAGRDIALTPRRTLALRADWSPLPAHRLGAGVTWVSSQHPDFANDCRMPSRATADARYAYQWGRAQWALAVNNLTDLKYYTQAYSCSGGVTQSIYPEAGRTLTASVRLQF